MAVIILAIIGGAWYWYNQRYTSGKIHSLSLSSDGRYAISTGWHKNAILWDLKKKLISCYYRVM